uniref:X-prolyl aminopeptidase (aminopeptidase P) 2, membrane-bound n=1 Tax=Astatotilapia calliptera TaxID=8154 RepID=A0AAX7V147_ASTCA
AQFSHLYHFSKVFYLCVHAISGNTDGAVARESTERNCSLTPPYLPSTAVNTSLQLEELRVQMRAMNISAYIIPATDAHLSEYIAPRDARLAFMTGFTGSAGTAVVTLNKAALWTDSRYWVQAERQMDCNWELEKDVSISSVAEWLISEVPKGDEIGFDPFLFSLSESHVSSPPVSLRTWQEKVEHIRTQMGDNPYKPTGLLLSALDETACNHVHLLYCLKLPLVRCFLCLFLGLFNMRGNDIPYNPFFYSYTLLTMDEIWLFLHVERVTEELKVYLNASCEGALCVQLKGYDTILDHLKNYVTRPGVKVWIGTEYTNYALYEVITPQDKLLTSSYSPVLTTKAVKDETEQQILRDAHVRDAIVVIQFLMWLEKTVPEGNATELTAAEYVDKCRRWKDSRGPSFATISASGPNAALAHYSPTKETNRRLTVDEMYLVDSGGQYLDGTTDITRTVHWGKPTEMQKEAFTRVLMGNIEISRTIFPSGTRGVNMEMLGRRALWEVGLNYGHGTGHGVGNYFGVHDFSVQNVKILKNRLILLIEPGYYKENDFGIRIEDVAVVVPVQTKYGNNYLTFDTVSLVPYDRKLIDMSLLSSEQLHWLNKYYETIRSLVGAELDNQGLHEEKDWMLRNTEPFAEIGSSASVSSSSLTLIALAVAMLHNIV